MARVVGQANGATRLATPEPKRRYSNGKALAKHFTNLPNVRPSTVVAQRFQTITSALLSDQGGEQCTEARRQLVRRFAAACVLAESMEAKLADGKQIDIPEFGLVASTLVRIARQIGVNRVAKVVNAPSLQQYLSRRGGVTSEAAE